MPTLPLDIFLYIIDLLAAGDDEDVKSLQILSLACKYMVPLCRKHIFWSLNLYSNLVSERFSKLLLKNPDIARYVTRLSYRVFNPISDHELNILDMLKEHASIQWIHLWSLELDCKWNNLAESVRSSLVSLIQLPTVTLLNIDSFKGFPATALSGCSNLVDLQFMSLDLAPPEVNQVISRSKIPTPQYIKTDTFSLAAILISASLHEGDPIVDFSRLQKAEFNVKSRDDLGQVNELIKVTTWLEYLYLGVVRPLGLAGLGATFAINAYRTLKILNLSLPFIGDNGDPLCGLSRELRFITGKNIIEKLELYVIAGFDESFQTESENWFEFDSVLTESGAFPMLHRVSVEIWWYPAVDPNPDMESLKEEKCPRLVESKAVEFNFSRRKQSGGV